MSTADSGYYADANEERAREGRWRQQERQGGTCTLSVARFSWRLGTARDGSVEAGREEPPKQGQARKDQPGKTNHGQSRPRIGPPEGPPPHGQGQWNEGHWGDDENKGGPICCVCGCFKPNMFAGTSKQPQKESFVARGASRAEFFFFCFVGYVRHPLRAIRP